MKLYVVRHTKVNVVPGICYGMTDVDLAETYSEELRAVIQNCPNFFPDQIFSSPLKRCMRLASDLFVNQDIVSDDRLCELNFGSWEMQDWNVISQTKEAQAWFDDYIFTTCPEGESFSDQLERTRRFLAELKRQNFKSVAIVTHGGIIRSIKCLLENIAPEKAFEERIDYGQWFDFEIV